VKQSVASQGDEWLVPAAAVIGPQNLTGRSKKGGLAGIAVAHTSPTRYRDCHPVALHRTSLPLQAITQPARVSGNRVTGFPVAANSALAMAGPMVATPSSPTPAGLSVPEIVSTFSGGRSRIDTTR
jgi:hypothetical protein